VLWLKVGPSNNNPNIVASYYLDYISEMKGIPLVVRTDGGTENVLIHDLQNALRLHYAADGPAGVIIGRSVSNQVRYFVNDLFC
jgi:hypothetical protein